MIRLPTNSLRPWPVFTLYYKNGGSWARLKTMGRDHVNFQFSDVDRPQAGMYITDIAQRAIPSYGTANFETPIGNINGQNINFADGQITAPDLKNKQVYIAVQVGEESERCVFWGVVDYQKDTFSPSGDPTMIGKRVYQCVDLLYYQTYRATLDYHGFHFGGSLYNRSPSMPYYNGRYGRDDLLQGNKSAVGSGNDYEPIVDQYGLPVNVRRFTYDGLGSLWTDLEVVQHAIHNGQRHKRLIEFDVVDAAGTLTVRQNLWKVREGERAWDFIGRVLRFQRGGGVARFDFDITTNGSPENPKILISPIHPADVTVVRPSDTSEDVILGADSVGSAITVDLTGDQRSVESFFSIGGLSDYQYDRVEVTGEKIQVLCQLTYGENTLIKLWTEDEETEFDAATDADPNRFDHVYRLFGFPRNWDGVTGNGNGTSGPSNGETNGIYFYCDDAGQLQQAANNNLLDAYVNPALIRILPDIPLHSGIDPETGEHYDGAGSQLGPSMRGRMLIHERTASDAYTPLAVQQRLKTDGIWIGSRSPSSGNITRELKDNYTKLVLTCCLELPYRASVAKGAEYDKAVTTKRMNLSGSHLWIGAKGAMFSIPKLGEGAIERFASTTFLRDDRDRLAHIASIAEQWYVRPHQAAKWALKDFGIGGSFTVAPEEEGGTPPTIDYPKIGQLVTTLNAAGGDQALNSPITQVIYDNREGVTYWSCDWGELEI